MITRKKIQKFVEENKNDLFGAGGVVLGCTALTVIGYASGNRHARKGWRVRSAAFDQYVPDMDKYLTLYITHKNRKVTELKFNRV